MSGIRSTDDVLRELTAALKKRAAAFDNRDVRDSEYERLCVRVRELKAEYEDRQGGSLGNGSR